MMNGRTYGTAARSFSKKKGGACYGLRLKKGGERLPRTATRKNTGDGMKQRGARKKRGNGAIILLKKAKRNNTNRSAGDFLYESRKK